MTWSRPPIWTRVHPLVFFYLLFLVIKKIRVSLQSNNKQILENMTYHFDKSPFSESGQLLINAIGRAMVDVHGDKGTSVMGMKLKYRGVDVARQIVQGSVTNDIFFMSVIDAFEERGYAREDFTIFNGYMD